MKALKFGGTSVGNPESIRQVTDIISSYIHNNEKILVVTSAMKGITNDLIAVGKMAANDNETYMDLTNQIIDKHISAIHELIDIKQQSKIIAQVKVLTNNMEDVLHGVFLLKELSNRTKDLVLSFGERLSSIILAEYIKQYGIESEWLDARQLIKTNDAFGNAKVLYDLTNNNIRGYFKQHNKLQIITGFIGSTLKGETTTLGRGGSDFTAALFGAALGVDEIEIWTDVNGVMTTDPRKVSDAFPQTSLSYVEAMEMSHFGAKVIYPPTLQPAFTKGIPLRIKNTFNPSFEGTVISEKTENVDYLIKGISSIEHVSIINLTGSGMVGVPGVASRLFDAMASKSINIILITQASSEHSICIALSPEDAEIAKVAIEEEFELEILSNKIDEIDIMSGLSVVAIIGENMRNTPGISGKMFEALGKNGINVISIAQGSSELNLSVVVSHFDLEKTLTTLHEAFFLSDVKTIHLFLVGTGLIGGTLLNQIKQQQEYLYREHMMKLKVVALSDINKMYFDKDGINLDKWKTRLDQSKEKTDMETYVDRMLQMNLSNSVFVDCTASEDVVKVYKQVLENTISITTPNKLASSGPLELYNTLYRTALKKGVKYLYETNVGAGLPVITTLNDLKICGDWILKIEGVLSGTLSYIFNTFDGVKKFSDVVREAKEKGFTEPDPRDDLNGLDVIRKILILSREVGYEMEMDEIKNIPLLPESCLKAKNVDNFFSELEKQDDHFEKLYKKAEKKGEKLRFVATMEDGKARVGLQSVKPDHPLYPLSGSDNMLSFTTSRYKERPLVIKGPGAGAEVTAAGVFAEIISIANFLP
ncbi:bifunctional aspartate kinase/homoserine dehydrogenase I [Bacteroidota bacterium]